MIFILYALVVIVLQIGNQHNQSIIPSPTTEDYFAHFGVYAILWGFQTFLFVYEMYGVMLSKLGLNWTGIHFPGQRTVTVLRTLSSNAEREEEHFLHFYPRRDVERGLKTVRLAGLNKSSPNCDCVS